MSESRIDELDVAGTADALASSVREQRLVAARRLALAVHWADQHPPIAVTGVGAWSDGEQSESRSRWDRTRTVAVQLGADGTPAVSEFAVVELGVHLATTTPSAAALLRDALEIRHRLPLLWAAVMRGDVDDWKARKAACATRALSRPQALSVDAQVVEALTGLPFGRALDVIEGKVVAADPEGHEARRREEAAKRYVALGRRPGPTGLRTLVAQTAAGDVARFDAMVDFLADLPGLAGDTDPKQVRRAKAFGLLADPARVCLLLAEHQVPADEVGSPVACASAVGAVLASLGSKALERLRPRTVLYLHLSEEAVLGRGDAQVARTPVGPLGIEQLREWLGTDRVVVKPVIDLTGQVSRDAYEVPADLAEMMRLREPFEVFPYGTLPSDKADNDHTRPYVPPDEGGPPGQTSTGNLGPLGRKHHNAKTFGGFHCYQPLPGLYLWLTPAGLWYRVDHTGTHPLGREVPEILRQTADAPSARTSRTELEWSSQLRVTLAA